MTTLATLIGGAPGGGKTTEMREEAIAGQERYVFAFPTIKLLKEQVVEFASATTDWHLVEVHCDDGQKGAVHRKLSEAMEAAPASKVAILTTHAAVMSPQRPDFTGWHLRIDEAPNAVQRGTVTMAVSRPYFQEKYRLNPLGVGGWSLLEPISRDGNWKVIERDTLASVLGELSKAVAGDIFVNVTTWDVDEFRWFSLWTPLDLGPCASIHIASATYQGSLGYLIGSEHLADSLHFQPREVPYERSGWPTVGIRYFSEQEDSTASWSRSEGRERIKKVGRYLATRVPHLGFWSANPDVAKLLEQHDIPGKQVMPLCAGQNEYRDRTSCAFIYSAKPSDDDQPLLDLFGLKPTQVRQAREDEDIFQFVMRGAIREKEFGENYEVYVYSAAQARRLEQRLIRDGMAASVEVEPIADAGLIAPPCSNRNTMGTPRRGKKWASEAERKRDYRERKAAEEGRVLREQPGRPPKNQ